MNGIQKLHRVREELQKKYDEVASRQYTRHKLPDGTRRPSGKMRGLKFAIDLVDEYIRA